MAFAPGGRLAGGLGDGTIEVWDVATGQPVRELRGYNVNVRHMVFTPCGQRLISANWDDMVHVWDMATGQLLHKVTLAPHAILHIGLAPDGAVLLITRSSTTNVMLWRLPFTAK